MPASKAKNFSQNEQDLAIIGRALAHPARVHIYSSLEAYPFIRNVDLIKILNLSKTSVQNHIKKLEEANLIQLKFANNSYHIQKSEHANELITSFLSDLGQGFPAE